MREFKYIINDPNGLHARPCGQLAKGLSRFSSDITAVAPKGRADAKRLLAMMKLSLKYGEELTFIIEGKDEDEAYKWLENY